MLSRCLQFLRQLNQCAHSYHLPTTFIAPQVLKNGITDFNLPEQWNNLFKTSSNSKSNISFDKYKYEVTLNVSKYKRDDLKVRISGRNKLIIQGVCEEEHEGKCVLNTFIWCYTVPDEYNMCNVETELSSDGVLTLTIPCNDKKEVHEEDREIKIRQTGQPKNFIKIN